MILHFVMFTWKTDVTPEQVIALTSAFDAMHGLVPGLISIQGSPDLGLRSTNPDYLLVVTFENAEAWHAYQAHPHHKALLSDVIEPMVAHRQSIQING